MTLEDAIKIFINRGYVEIENGQIFDGDAWRKSYKIISDALEDGRLIIKVQNNDTTNLGA